MPTDAERMVMACEPYQRDECHARDPMAWSRGLCCGRHAALATQRGAALGAMRCECGGTSTLDAMGAGWSEHTIARLDAWWSDDDYAGRWEAPDAD